MQSVYNKIKKGKETMKKNEGKPTLMIRVALTKEEWNQFKEMVAPINVSDAVATMIRSAIKMDSEPFAKVIEEIFVGAIKRIPRTPS